MPGESVTEEAEVATKPVAPAASTVAEMPPADDEGYVWPEGMRETAIIEVPASSANAPEPKVVATPLPSLDELVKLIPADARDILDDLFRAKFVGVKRVAPSSLKN